MRRVRNIQPAPLSPEDNLQEISMLEDQLPTEDYMNPLPRKNQPFFIEGWIRSKQQQEEPLIALRSTVLEATASSDSSPNMTKAYSSSVNLKRKASVSFNGDQTPPRPLSSSSHHLRIGTSRVQIPSHTPRHAPLKMSDSQDCKMLGSSVVSGRYEPMVVCRRAAVQAIHFPIFTMSQNPERLTSKTSTVGRIRKLLQVKQHHHQK